MGYRHLSLCCKCGQTAGRIDEVGLTDDRELVIHWWCEDCQRVVYASKSLDEFWQDGPDSQTAVQPESPVAVPEHFDDRFLKSLGICLMDEA